MRRTACSAQVSRLSVSYHYDTSEKIRKDLDIGCGFFGGLSQSFWYWPPDTIIKIEHNRIRWVSNDWFKSYLSNFNQYVSINGYDPNVAARNCGAP